MTRNNRLHRLFSVLVLLGMVLSLVAPTGFVQAARPESASSREVKREEPPPDGLRPVVRSAVRHDVSQPLGKLAESNRLGTLPLDPTRLDKLQSQSGEVPYFNLPKAKSSNTIGSRDMNIVQQNRPVGPGMPGTEFNFDGIANPNGYLPPDTNGDIGYDPVTGKKYYMQWVNASLAVWDVTTQPETLVMGPMNGNLIWSGFGGICETNNDGDPIVLYDHLAGQWMISQFALDFGTPDFHQCIAISETGDPTGAWYRYDFQVSTTKMNDYPHFGVWPDGYYMSINQFDAATFGWAGGGAVVFEREKMLQGQAAQMVYFDLYGVDPNFGGMLPSDLDGPPPPAGTPNFFAEWDDGTWFGGYDALRVWEFHVDWANPANSTFGVAGQPNYIIPTADVDPDMCGFARNCIPQPGGSALDAIADRLMYRLQYRNFGDHQTLVGNRTVDADGTDHAGVYWFELRDIGTGWDMYQEGVYAPDSDNRWMGSIAMDQSGNIALGYSVSSSSTYPSVRYDGRLDGDPLGQMTQGEAEIVAGSGYQEHSSGRWGDYSMMGVDPTDDCTFWYTQEYYAVVGSAPWQTRIGSFRFPSCGATVAKGTLTGVVDDGSNPLEGITVRAVNGTTDMATATNASGVYTLTLPVGDYDVSAFGYGYQSAAVSGVGIVTDTVTTQNFSLSPAAMYTIDGTVNDAYAQVTEVLTASFDSGVPATWTAIDNAGNGVEWEACSAWGANYTNGSGDCVGASSDAGGNVAFDAELRTPVIDLSNAIAAEVSFTANYQNFAAHDFLNVDVSTDGGTTWETISTWNEDHGAFFATPGEDITLDLSNYAGQQIILRWHYYDPSGAGNDWYAQIDDVIIVTTDPVVRWPLYAHVSVSSDAPGFPGMATWTDPATGQYSFSVAEGYTYTLDVEAFSDGYLPASVDVPSLSGDTTQDIFLLADMDTCAAPGYYFDGFYEDFEGGVPPADWAVVDNAGSGLVWMTNADYGDGNYTGGEGLAADVNSDIVWFTPYDTELWSAPIDMTALPSTDLQYKFNFQVYSGSEALDVDISTDSGATWTNLRHWTTNQGALYGLPGASDTIDLSAYAAETNVILRWRYYTPDSSPWDWYAQVDDVQIGQCTPLDGGLAVGNVYDAYTTQPLNGATVENDFGFAAATVPTPNDDAVDDGFYTAFAPAGSHVFTATMSNYGPDVETVAIVADDTVVQDFYLNAGLLTAAPDGLDITLPMGVSDTLTMTVSNMGAYTASYALAETDGGMIPMGPFQRPDWVMKSFKSNDENAQRVQREQPNVPPYAAGDVLQTWAASAQSNPWGLAFDAINSTVWAGEGWGSNEIFQYAVDGTYTGVSYPFTWGPAYGPADATYNINTGMIWSLDVGSDNCIHEIDPASGVTGNTICPAFSVSQRGLAYDPTTDTYFAGGWNDAMVYRFDSSGNILSSVNTGLSISGLAYNPTTQHLFVMVNGSPNLVYVLDVANGYTNLGSFSIAGFGDYAGAGLGIDCDGNLWAVNQSTSTVYQVESGETASFCDVPWLSEEPITGTLAVAASDIISVTFDASVPEVDQPGEYHAAIRVNNDTPYDAPLVPVTMTVTAPPTWGKLQGTVTDQAQCHASPVPVEGAEVLIEVSTGTWITTTLPAYTFTEDFESWPPAGWTIVNNGGDCVWDSTANTGRTNYAGGDGDAADADSDACGSGTTMDTELWSPVMDLAGYITATLTFSAAYNDVGSGDYFEVDVSSDGGATWSNVLSWDEDHSAYGPGEAVSIDLSPYVSDQVVVRFHYAGSWDWYAEVDQVRVTAPETTFLEFVPDAAWETTTDENGYYSLWLDESYSPLTVTVTAPDYTPGFASGVMVTGGMTTTQDFDVWMMEPCVTADPDAFQVTVAPGMSTTLPLNLTNGGGISTTYELAEQNGGFTLAMPQTTTPIESTVPKEIVTFGDLQLASVPNASGAQNTPARPPLAPETVFLTHSASQTIMSGNSVSCNAGGIHADNSYLRVFTLSDFGINTDLTVTSIDVGVEEASAGSGGTQPATVNLYTLDGPLVWANMTLIGTADVDVADQSLSIINVPVNGVVPAGGTLVVEFFTPDGQADGNSFFVGSNNLGQTAPTYLAAADCGVSEPTDTAALGFPDMHLVMNVIGEIEADIPWLFEDPISGTLAEIGGTEAVTLTFDASVPEASQPGVYTGTLMVTSGDPASPVAIPVTMTVTVPATWGKIDGTVTGLGYCDANPMPLEGAEVLVEASGGYTNVVTTDASGYFGLWLDETNSPARLTVTADGYELGSAVVAVSAGNTTTQDFDLRWLQPCVSTVPASFDVTLSVSSTLTQTLTIFNDGAVGTDFSIAAVTDPWLSVTPLGGTLDADSQGPVDIVFNTNTTPAGDYTTTLQITTDDPVTPTLEVPVYLHVVTYGVEIAPPTDAITGNVGTVVTYTLTVTNAGTTTDTFDLSLSGNAWTASAPATVGPLAAGASATVEVYVTIPANAADGDTDVMTVTVTSQSDNTVMDTAVLTTTANVPGYFIYLPLIFNTFTSP